MPSQAQFTFADYRTAAEAIRQLTTHQPTVGIILGSGLGSLTDAVEDSNIITTSEIPRWPQPTVKGHAGRIVIGQLEGQSVLVLQGRVHFYEGYTMQEVTFPVRVMQALGLTSLFVTNAAGGLNRSFSEGDLMLIKDHINMPGMVGNHPLI